MLKLSHLTHFAAGSGRLCFVHPNDPTKCVKTLLPHRNPCDVRKSQVEKKWIDRFRPLSKFDLNLREIDAYRRLDNAGDPRVFHHVARHFGLIETDMGTGAVVELIRNRDGSPAPTLADKIRCGEFPEQALAEFRAFLGNPGLSDWTDMQISNLVVAPSHKQTDEKLVVIDGMTYFTLRMIKNSIPYLRQQRVRRKCALFEERLTLYIKRIHNRERV